MTEQKSAMEDYEIKDCQYIVGTPDEKGRAPNYSVGKLVLVSDNPFCFSTVTRITLQSDVHAEYCMRTRACVWVGDKLIFECPYQALTGVGYSI